MVVALGESYTSISDYVVYVFRLNDSRMVTALGESYTSISDYVVYIFRPNDSNELLIQVSLIMLFMFSDSMILGWLQL